MRVPNIQYTTCPSAICGWVKKGTTPVRNLPIFGPDNDPESLSRPGKGGNTPKTRASRARFWSVLLFFLGRERDFRGLRTGAKRGPSTNGAGTWVPESQLPTCVRAFARLIGQESIRLRNLWLACSTTSVRVYKIRKVHLEN